MKRFPPFFLILCLLLIACKPTPTEEAVMNRADNKLEQAIVAPPAASYTYEVPSRWEETFAPRNREVRFIADVEVPTAEQFPIVTIRQHRLTAEDVIGFLEALCPGEWTMRENEYSREELMEDLKKASNMYLGEDDTGAPVYGANEEEMRRIQKLIDEAPLQDTYNPLNAQTVNFPIPTVPVRDSTGTVWYLFAKSKETGAALQLRKRQGTTVYTEQWSMQPGSEPYRPNGLTNVKITEAEAIKQADAFIAALGLSDYRAADVQKAIEIQGYTLAECSEGYLLRYVPALDGTIPCCFSQSPNPDFLPFTNDAEITYAPPWRQEYAELYITEEGVMSFWWDAPKEHIMTANENVRLLSFSEIQSCIRKIMEYGLGDWEGSPVLVKRMVLSTSVAQIKDQGDEAFFVPTWVIFLTTEQDEEIHRDIAVLLVNAIDGTVIARTP